MAMTRSSMYSGAGNTRRSVSSMVPSRKSVLKRTSIFGAARRVEKSDSPDSSGDDYPQVDRNPPVLFQNQLEALSSQLRYQQEQHAAHVHQILVQHEHRFLQALTQSSGSSSPVPMQSETSSSSQGPLVISAGAVPHGSPFEPAQQVPMMPPVHHNNHNADAANGSGGDLQSKEAIDCTTEGEMWQSVTLVKEGEMWQDASNSPPKDRGIVRFSEKDEEKVFKDADSDTDSEKKPRPNIEEKPQQSTTPLVAPAEDEGDAPGTENQEKKAFRGGKVNFSASTLDLDALPQSQSEPALASKKGSVISKTQSSASLPASSPSRGGSMANNRKSLKQQQGGFENRKKHQDNTGIYHELEVQRRASEWRREKHQKFLDRIPPAFRWIFREIEEARQAAKRMRLFKPRQADEDEETVRFEQNMKGNIRQVAHHVMHHRFFESAVTLLICCNALQIGLYADWAARTASVSREGLLTPPQYFRTLERLFIGCFTFELLVRLVAEGSGFLFGINWQWNWFDLLLVLTAIVEELMAALVTHDEARSGSMTSMRIMRIMRLVRVIRVIRIMRFFRELRMMVAGIKSSLNALFWALVLLLLIMFMFGVYVIQIAAEEAQVDVQGQFLKEAYHSLPGCLYSLFKGISNGQNWGPIAAPLVEVSPIYAILYMLFIALVVFAVLNVVTGVFVETAMQTAQRDMENSIVDEIALRRCHMAAVKEVFNEVDEDNSGTITWDEFKMHLMDENVLAFFRKLGLDMHEPRDLFELLDFDGNGEVDSDEFVMGFTQLKGPARSLDLARVRHDVMEVSEQIAVLTMFVEDEFAELNGPTKDWECSAPSLQRPSIRRKSTNFAGRASVRPSPAPRATQKGALMRQASRLPSKSAMKGQTDTASSSLPLSFQPKANEDKKLCSSENVYSFSRPEEKSEVTGNSTIIEEKSEVAGDTTTKESPRGAEPRRKRSSVL